jgi:hypothetical protein
MNDKIKPAITILILTLLGDFARAQFIGHPPFFFGAPVFYKGYEKSNEAFDGVVFKTGGEEITGTVKFGKNEKVMVRPESENKFTEIQNVTKVRLYQSDTNLIPQNHTEYKYLKIGRRQKWYRQLVEGEAGLFDQTTFCNEIPNYVNWSDIVIRRDTSYESINNFWSMSYKADLVKSLNQIFGTEYKNRDFKTKKEVIERFRLLASN